jgi:simple sugar transport system permease protein
LLVGANPMQRVVQVPSALVIALNGLVVVFVVSSEIWRRKRQRRRLAAIGQDEESPPSTDKEKLPEAETAL